MNQAQKRSQLSPKALAASGRLPLLFGSSSCGVNPGNRTLLRRFSLQPREPECALRATNPRMRLGLAADHAKLRSISIPRCDYQNSRPPMGSLPGLGSAANHTHFRTSFLFGLDCYRGCSGTTIGFMLPLPLYHQLCHLASCIHQYLT
jgi:hypothetical protein